MTPYEEICVTRVYQATLGTIDRKSITKEEIDIFADKISQIRGWMGYGN